MIVYAILVYWAVFHEVKLTFQIRMNDGPIKKHAV